MELKHALVLLLNSYQKKSSKKYPLRQLLNILDWGPTDQTPPPPVVIRSGKAQYPEG